MLRLKKKYRMCWCVCYCKGTPNQFNGTVHTHAKIKINTMKSPQPQFLQKEAGPSFCPYPRQGGTKHDEGKPSSQPQCSH